MFIIKWLTLTNPDCKAAVSSPSELFELMWILDTSDHTIAWTVDGTYRPSFAMDIKKDKYVDEFNSEHFDQVIVSG